MTPQGPGMQGLQHTANSRARMGTREAVSSHTDCAQSSHLHLKVASAALAAEEPCRGL